MKQTEKNAISQIITQNIYLFIFIFNVSLNIKPQTMSWKNGNGNFQHRNLLNKIKNI